MVGAGHGKHWLDDAALAVTSRRASERQETGRLSS